MRILWLSHFVPYPPKGGVFQRGYNLLTRIAARHPVQLLAVRHKESTHPQAELELAKAELERHCQSVEIFDMSARTRPSRLGSLALSALATGEPLTVKVYDAPGLRETVARYVAGSVDVVHLDTISLARFLPDLKAHPVVLTHLGPESLMIRRRIPFEKGLTKRAFFHAEWRLLQRYERRVCPAVDLNVTMSRVDRDVLSAIAPDARFVVVPNGVDTNYFQAGPVPDTQSLIFAGRLDQYASLDGIMHFITTTWPLVRTRYPAATLTVVGLNPPDVLRSRASADPQIRLLGYVPDIRPHFRQAAVSICPLRDGGGTRLKVLDAMALGMPIVTTSMGCEGIDVVPEEHVLVADTPAAFAAQIGRVLDDKRLRDRLASAARSRAESHYDWDDLARRLEEAYRSVVRAPAVGAQNA